MTLLAFLALAVGAAPQERLAVPSDADVRSAERAVRDLLKADYARRDPDSKKALAQKLLAQAAVPGNDAATRYVLLRDARDLAAEAEDLATALSAVDRLGERFDVNELEMKAGALRAMRSRARTAEAGAALAAAFLELSDQALAKGDPDAALRAAREGEQAARAARDAGLAAEAARRLKEIPELKKEADEAARAELRLSVAPDDADACLALGLYLCFVRDDWARGLPLLERGSNAAVRDAAQKDRSAPRTAPEQIEAGEAWFAAGEKDRAGGLLRTRAFGRARFWLEQAYPNAEGLARLRLDQRLEAIEKATGGRGTVDLLALMGGAALPAGWQREGRVLLTPPSGASPCAVPYAPPDEYDLRITVSRAGRTGLLCIVLAAGDRRLMLVVDDDGLGLEFLNGQPWNRNETTARTAVFADDRPRTIVCSVRRSRVAVSVDGRTLVDWKADYGRVTLRSNWQVGDPKGLVVGSYMGGYRITQMVLVPVSGMGRRL